MATMHSILWHSQSVKRTTNAAKQTRTILLRCRTVGAVRCGILHRPGLSSGDNDLIATGRFSAKNSHDAICSPAIVNRATKCSTEADEKVIFHGFQLVRTYSQ